MGLARNSKIFPAWKNIAGEEMAEFAYEHPDGPSKDLLGENSLECFSPLKKTFESIFCAFCTFALCHVHKYELYILYYQIHCVGILLCS